MQASQVYQTQGQNAAQVNQGVPKSPFRYPNQVTCSKRQELNLYCELSVNCPSIEELQTGAYPGLEVFGKTKFNMFIFKYEDKSSVKYGLSAADVKYIYSRTLGIINTPKKKTDVTLSPGYTVLLKGGIFNNKTAAEMLIENPNLRNDILRQRDFLLKNVNHPKYGRNNQKMVDAINDAVIALDNGQLDPNKLSSNTIVLFEGIKTPNNKKLDNRGLTEARQFRLTYTPGTATPFSVTIMNCMAPPADAMVGAKLEQAVDCRKWNYGLTEVEWYNFIDEMYQLLEDIRVETRQRRFSILGTTPRFH